MGFQKKIRRGAALVLCINDVIEVYELVDYGGQGGKCTIIRFESLASERDMCDYILYLVEECAVVESLSEHRASLGPVPVSRTEPPI